MNKQGFYAMFSAVLVALLLAPGWVFAETVYVEGQGEVDLAPFACDSISRSAIFDRICYDIEQEYVIAGKDGAYTHYCEVPWFLLTAWLDAESMDDYFHSYVEGNHDCRTHYLPDYGN